MTASDTPRKLSYQEEIRYDLMKQIAKLEAEIAALKEEEQESKEEPKDMYDYPLTTANNHVQLYESKEQSAEEILARITGQYIEVMRFDPNGHGVTFTEAIKAMKEYSRQSRREEILAKDIIFRYDLKIKKNLSELHPVLRDHGIQSTICDNLNKIRDEFTREIT